MKHLILAGFIVLLISLVACGKPTEEPVRQEVTVDCAEVMATNQYLLLRQKEFEEICQRLQDNQVEYITAVRTMENANLALGVELALAKALGEQRSEDYEDLLNEVIDLRAERKDWGILASQEYSRILENYNKLASIYPPRDFSDTGELEEWLEEDDTDSNLILVPDDDGVASFKEVCEEFALQLMQRARESGYIMSFYIMERQEYFNLTGTQLPEGRLHAVNLVIIGNNIYLIEPQTDEYWLKGHLD